MTDEVKVAHILALVEKCFGAEEGWGRVRLYNEIEAALLAPQQTEGWVMVPVEIVDRFPEINTSNYDHDDACALNAWGVELVLAATPSAPTAGPDERSGQLLDQALAAIQLVRACVMAGAESGFNPLEGDWAERLYRSQGDTYEAVRAINAARASKGTK